ncbi:MAG: 50S ribosomal protein L35 [Candidatus Yonathbacteria bacterium]|nr:50S ribosomal protein L35 [Candidatus Yonathbacteria bacterium]
MKTNKSFKKRVKVTKSGKVIVRGSGINHFNAKKSRTSQLDKKGGQELEMTQKSKSRFLSNQ